MDASITRVEDDVILAKLVAFNIDILDYTTYVFENVERKYGESKYLMCVKFPNWNCKELDIGDLGYLHYKRIIAGRDKWFDGTNMVPYLYDNIQFLAFVDKPKEDNNVYKM